MIKGGILAKTSSGLKVKDGIKSISVFASARESAEIQRRKLMGSNTSEVLSKYVHKEHKYMVQAFMMKVLKKQGSETLIKL